MPNPGSNPPHRWQSLIRLGEMVYAQEPMEALMEELRPMLSAEDGESWPFALLCHSLALDTEEACCLALCLWAQTENGPELGAEDLYSHYSRLSGGLPGLPLDQLFVGKQDRPVPRRPIMDFLLGYPPWLPPGARLDIPEPGESFHPPRLLEEMSRFARRAVTEAEPVPALLVLEGEEGSGRTFLFRSLAEQLGCLLLLLPPSGAEPELWADMRLVAALYNALVCIRGTTGGERLEALVEDAGLLLLSLDSGDRLHAPDRCVVLRRQVPPLPRESSWALFRALTASLPWEEDSPLEDNSLLRLNPGQLADLSRQLRAQHWATGAPVGREQIRALSQRSATSMGPGASLLESGYTLEDLILPEQQKVQLSRVCGFYQARQRVFQDWGFGGKASWGQGMTVLFYGAPGTGKTMAATAVANQLGLPLYRVDLSQLISKYIGETQKNIGQLFDQGAKSGCILFFDEADALFSRRNEAGDSQDKHANAEIAYLLQRTEAHSGLCILATNLLQNFDEAFRRRITYMINFPLPDKEQRRRIWEGVFPPQTPLGELDLELLAERLELSGASIRSCALHGAYLAAVRDRPVTMGMILEGAREEYAKQGKSLPPHMLQLLSNQEVLP